MSYLFSKPKPICHLLLSISSPSSRFLSVSFLSTSSSSHSQSSSYSSSSRRHDEESRNVKVSVWWDIENCGVPTGVNVFKIAPSITTAVRVNGIKGPVQISAFGDVLCISRPNQEALSSTGINLIHVPHGGRNSADRSLLVDLMYWVSQNPPPAHIFLISSDRDFAGILHRLRMNNYNILLAGKEGCHTPGVLCSAASIMWQWNELAKGENLSGRHFNQPPDGPFNSWYGHYRGHLEDPFDVSEQQNFSRATNDSSNAELSSDKVQPVPKVVLKQISQIVNSYPYGLSITELRAQMARSNVTLDRSFYGHKKFSRLLLSIPHVVKVVSGSDGQFFLRPVSPKVTDPVESDYISVGTTEKGNQDAPVTRKTKGENHSIARMADVGPRLCMSSNDVVEEKTVQVKVEEAPDKKSDAPRKEQVSSIKGHHAKETLDSQVFEGPVAPTEEQNPKSELGVLRRLRKWFSGSIKVEKPALDISDKSDTARISQETPISEERLAVSTNQHEIPGPSDSFSNVDVKSGINGKSEVSMGFVTKVLSWFRYWKNEKPVNTLSELSTEGPSLEDSRKHEGAPLSKKPDGASLSRKLEDGPHPRKHEDAPTSMRIENAPYSRKHEIFSMETFWNIFESFLRTHKGSEIVLNSESREQFVKRLKNDGPMILHPLQESDLLHLLDLLVSEKKWIKEFPTKSPRFRIDLPPGNSSTSVQVHNSNGLSSLFLGSSSGNPQLGISSIIQKKPQEKTRSDILSDCQKLLDELLQEYPEGFNMGLFRKEFFDTYGYTLEYQKLGYPKLVSLLQIMPGVKIESSNIFPDSVVYAPGIGSLGTNEKSTGSDSEVSDSPQKDDDVESPWEELGPIENSNIGKQGEESSSRTDSCEYEPSVSEDDEFSDVEEDESSTRLKAEERSRSRVNEEDSSLLQILNTWYSSKDERDRKEHASTLEGLVDCSKDETVPSGSSTIGVKSEASSTANNAWKSRSQKSYTFVSDSLDSNKDKLIDGILGSLKKSGESRMQS